MSTTPEGESPVLAVPPAEAARMLSLSRPMIYKLIHSGELRTVNIGRTRRVPVSELERLIDVDGRGGPTDSLTDARTTRSGCDAVGQIWPRVSLHGVVRCL